MKALITNDKGYTQIFLDGEEVHRVTSVQFTDSVNGRPQVSLEILPDEIECVIDGVDVTKKVLSDCAKDKEMREGYRDFVRFLFRGLESK